MYEQDLALNDLQRLICRKTTNQPTTEIENLTRKKKFLFPKIPGIKYDKHFVC